MSSNLECIIAIYPIVAIISSALWKEDLINLALVSKTIYATLRGSSNEYWVLLNRNVRTGCKFEETGQYDHTPDTPSPLNRLSPDVSTLLEDPELAGLLLDLEKHGSCVTCGDRICLGCACFNRVSDVIGLSSISPEKSGLLWRRIRHFCHEKCCDKKLTELRTTRADIKACFCDVAAIKNDETPWICPPCSYRNEKKDQIHDQFQEGCVRELTGDVNESREWRRAESWQDRITEEQKNMEERGFCCGCNAWAKDEEGQGFMLCSWCNGEVQPEWP